MVNCDVLPIAIPASHCSLMELWEIRTLSAVSPDVHTVAAAIHSIVDHSQIDSGGAIVVVGPLVI
jgi:hypothetical protein